MNLLSSFKLAVYEKDGPRTDSENRELTSLALKGLQLLATWSAYVVEMVLLISAKYEQKTYDNYSISNLVFLEAFTSYRSTSK